MRHMLFFLVCFLCGNVVAQESVSIAEDAARSWLVSSLDDIQGRGRVHGYASLEVAYALLGVSSDSSLALGLQTYLSNLDEDNVDFSARQRLAGIALQESRDEIDAAYGENGLGGFGWGLSKSYSPSVLDTALVLRTLDEVEGGSEVGDSVVYLSQSQLSSGGWALGVDGDASIYVTSHALIALQRFDYLPLAVDLANRAISFLSTASLKASQLERAVAAQALYQAEPDSPVTRLLVASLIEEQEQNGSWSDDIVTTATVVKLLRLVLGDDAELLDQALVINTYEVREQINTALGRNDYDRITYADLRALPDLDLTEIQFTSLFFLADAQVVTTLTLSASYILTLSDISVLLSMPNLQSLWLGGQFIDMTVDADNDGLPDGLEIIIGTGPNNPDSDSDQLPDGWEVRYEFDPLSTPGTEDTNLDPDGDFSTNIAEYQAGTDPTNPVSKPGIIEGVIAYYPMAYAPKYGSTVHDFSGYGEPLNLEMSGSPSWLPGNGISLEDVGDTLSSSGAASKLGTAISTSGQFTVELWGKMASLAVPTPSPSRIVSYSNGATSSNFTLGQSGPDFVARVRTATSNQVGLPELIAQDQATLEVQHLVMTYDGVNLSIFKNGALVAEQVRDDLISGWDSGFPLIIGDEVGGLRPWNGDIYQLTIYDRALSDDEVLRNTLRTHHLPDFDADGVPDLVDDFPLDPALTFDSDSDSVPDVDDNCDFVANLDQADFDADGQGDVCDADDDNDGYSDEEELDAGLDPFNPADAGSDQDSDGFTLIQEITLGTDPLDPSDVPQLTQVINLLDGLLDEIEEGPGGVSPSASIDLGMGNGAPNNEGTVGLRFDVPVGDSPFSDAYIQFSPYPPEPTSGPAQFQIAIEDDPQAPNFGWPDNSILDRTFTGGVSWTVPDWGYASTPADHRTPNIASLLNEMRDQAGTASSMSVVLSIGGTGYRNASSLESGYPNTAPQLILQKIPLPDVSIDSDADGEPNYLDNDDDNDSIPDGWEYQNGLDWLDPADGEESLSLLADPDGDGYSNRMEYLYDSDPQDIASVPVVPVTYAVEASNDDAHESPTGTVISINRLFFDQGTVGMRFALPLAPGVTVKSAYVQFTAYNMGVESGNYLISAEASDDAASFDTAMAYDISSRTLGTGVSWTAGDWAGTGEATENERTPDISAVINEVLSRSGWAEGNHIALVITGSGNHRARAFDFSSGQQAPRLVLGLVRPYEDLLDSDNDGQANYLDSDDDNDTVPDSIELSLGLDPYDPTDVLVDQDSDGFALYQEILNGTSDTDMLDYPTSVERTISLVSNTEHLEEDYTTGETADGFITTDLGIGSGAGPYEGIVGLRYALPVDSISEVGQQAYVQFSAYDSTWGPADFTVQIEDAGNAAPLQEISNNISSRSYTGSVSWQPDNWNGSSSSETLRSPNIASLLHHIVSRQDWQSGNHILLKFTGTGYRNAGSWTTTPPVLHIVGAPSPAYVVDTDGDGIQNYLDTDDDNDSMPDAWEISHGFDPLDNADGSNDVTTVTDPDMDGYTNSEEHVAGSDPNSIDSFPPETLVLPVASPADDAEQSASTSWGTMYLADTVIDARKGMFFGLRFAVPLENAARITGARLSFYPAANDQSDADWSFGIEDSANAAAISSANNDLSARTLEATQVLWSVPGWESYAGGNAEESPELMGLIQAAMANSGWQAGNHVLFVVETHADADPRRFYAFESNQLDLVAKLIIDYLPDISPRRDLDRDGIYDVWELSYGFDPADPADAGGVPSAGNDPDGDGYTNLEEFLAGSNPHATASKPGPTELRIPIAALTDDLEFTDNDVDDRNYMEMKSGQNVALRFDTGAWDAVHAGKSLVGAYLEFTAEPGRVDSNPVGYEIRAVDLPDISALSANHMDLNAMPRSSTAVSWVPETWYGDAGVKYATAGLEPLFAHLENVAGWIPGNGIALVIEHVSGDKRKASSYNVTPYGSAAPELVLRYVADADKDGLPDGWEQRHGLDMYDAADGGSVVNAVTDPDADGYVNRDEYELGTDPNVFDATQPVSQTVSVVISDNLDDGWQRSSNIFEEGKPKIELESGRIPGFRFQVPDIPQGATVESAYIQFSAKGNDSGALLAEVYVEATDDAIQLGEGASESLYDRTWSSSSVSWSMAGWADHQRDVGTRTPDIASLIQQVVDQSGWQAGNHMVFKLQHISGDKRGIKDFGGAGAVDAAELVITFTP